MTRCITLGMLPTSFLVTPKTCPYGIMENTATTACALDPFRPNQLHLIGTLNAKRNRSLVVFEISWGCGYVLRARLRMEI